MARIRKSRPDEAARLFEIWQAAVAVTHDFVSAEDLMLFSRIVRDEYLPHAFLWVIVDEEDRPLGFMGMTESKVDSLFIDPEHHGRGLGAALMRHARGLFPSLTVDVNEQNKGAVAFYRRIGFEEVGRSPRDDSGRPYPLLHFRLEAG
jgi:putative acetyltransferase